ncbi:MAG: hypothetical protein GTN76_09380, partial [Candidatus Aenigmarchaeota archaeon]|nr:hypothetical protein [Candidatus Aenigmarchaeota archaeon]
MSSKLAPLECLSCPLLIAHCKIQDEWESNPERWETFAEDCGKLDVIARMDNVDKASLNRFDRSTIMDEIYPFFFPSGLFSIPVETIKRVLIDKWDNIFPEYATDPQISNYYKWGLRLEIINKYCQLAETLGAHLIAAQIIGDKYENFHGYTLKLVEYNVSDVVNFYQNITHMSNEDLARIMGYPNIDGQSKEGKELLEDSLFYLKVTLRDI